MSAFTSITTNSHKSRPFSASSKKKSRLPIEKKGRGLGYFGDITDKIKAHQDKVTLESKYRVKLDQQLTND